MRRNGKCGCRTKVKLGGRSTRLARTSFECAGVGATILLASTTLLNGLLSSRRSQRKSYGMTTLQSQSARYGLWGHDGQRASTSMWTNSHGTNGRKANFFAVWRGKKSGVFYKWSDCKAALRGHMDPGFKGYRTLQEAYDGLRENLSRLKMAAER